MTQTIKDYATPMFGIGGGFGAYYLKFVEFSTPVIEHAALCIGFLVALITLGIQYKKLRKLG